MSICHSQNDIKTFKTNIVIVVQITNIVSERKGIIIKKNIPTSPAPSIRAASIVSSGIALCRAKYNHS